MIGYKLLRLDTDGCLRSLYAKHLWTADANEARCQFGTGLLMRPTARAWPDDTKCPEPPDASCSCGFYFYQRPELTGCGFGTGEEICMALVHAYGKLIEHADGTWRSQWMMMLALVGLGIDDYGYYELYQPDNFGERAKKASDMLGVPYIVTKDLPEAWAWLKSQAESANHHD